MRHSISFLFLAVAPSLTVCAATAPRSLPIFFVSNAGQTDPAFLYSVQTHDLRAGFARDCVVFERSGTRISLRFDGASPSVRVQGTNALPGRANFLLGSDPNAWHIGVPTFQSIVYRDLYPGIDVTYAGTDQKIKSEFLVAPGAEPARIRLEYSGAGRVYVDDAGDLVVRAGATELHEQAPLAYQNYGGVRHLVTAGYNVAPGGRTVTFDLGAYDTTQPLVIDPVISYSTYMGGTAQSSITALAVDSSGSVYAAGWTESVDFPVSNAIQAVNRGGVDAFLLKLNPAGTTLLYASYIGGRGDDRATAIAIDPTGQIFLAGSTASTNFPLASAIRSTLGGPRDAFVVKLNAFGNLMVYSTYLGGSGYDTATGIALDSSGNAYISGDTQSADFPLSSPVQATFGGKTDAFVTKLTAAGALSFSTYLGGSNDEHAAGIAVDSSGGMYVAGGTSSTNFLLAAPIQATNGGSQDAFVAKISATPLLVYSTYLGGSGGQAGSPEQANAIVVDATGAAYIAGVTNSSNFPVTAGAFQTAFNGVQDAFITKLNPAGSSKVYSTYLGSGGGSQSNSQCTLNGAGSSASLAGTNLALTVSLSFQPGFAGGKTLYLYAADASTNTGFLAKGAWTVSIPPPTPSADSVSPNTSSGSTQSFAFVFSDTQNSTNLSAIAMLFNTSVTFTNACYIVYDPQAGNVALINDNALGSGSKPVASTTVLQNSQCQVGATSIVAAGLSEIFTVTVTFKGAFNGLKNMYMYASEGLLNTGWVQRGTYLVASGGFPLARSVVPAAGFGPAQRFSFTVSDSGGSGYLTAVAMLFASTLNPNNACSLVYDRTLNVISLAYDNPANGASPLIPGSSTVVSNHQCTLRGANSTVAAGTTDLVITLDLAFNAAFFGAKNAYLYAAEPFSNSGWVTVGSWTVTGGAPTADAVSPATGSGISPNFTFTVSDSNSDLNLTGLTMLLTAGAPTALTNACYLSYNRNAATIGLYADDGVTLNSKGIGSAATLQNSQCAVGFTVMVTSGNSILFTINLVFKSPAFSGVKTVYLQALEPNTSSGWVARGTWTVP